MAAETSLSVRFRGFRGEKRGLLLLGFSHGIHGNARKGADAQLLILYGRRRVGKTRLVKEFFARSSSTGWMVNRGSTTWRP